MSKKHLRKRYFVDAKIQGSLVGRAVRYWGLSVSVVGMLTVVGWIFVAPGLAALVESPERLRATVLCLLIAISVSALLLPVVLYDMVRFSHRFAGPMVRLRDCMRRAAAGEEVGPLRFRDDDYWQELADAFNAMQVRMNGQTTSAGQTRRGDAQS